MNDPDFSEHDEIRRLLADARVTSEVPDAVAARLDGVLAELVDARATNVVPLRRRALPRLLAAAAVVVVVGGGAAGITQLVRANNGTSPAQADSATGSATAGRAAAGSAGMNEPSAPLSQAQKLPATLSHVKSLVAAPALTTVHFRAEVTRLLDQNNSEYATRNPLASSLSASPSPTSGTTDSLAGSAPAACETPASTTADDEVLAITLDGAPAVLVVHPVQDHEQVADAYGCTVTPSSTSFGTSGATNGGVELKPDQVTVQPLASASIPR